MTDPYSLHVATAGDPKLPPVLLLHGFLGSTADWSFLVERWADRYCCCAVDLPGHGQSCGRSDDLYSMEGASRWLAGEMRARSSRPWLVIGYSMGGRLAMHLLDDGQLPIRGAMLESCSPGLESDAERAERLRRDEAWAGRLEKEPFSQWLRAWYDQPLFASLKARPDLTAALAERRAGGQPRELARALRGLTVAKQKSFWGRLKDFAAPLRWVAGEQDAAYVALARRAAGLSPAAGVSTIADSGHVAHVEQPARFAAAAEEFLRSLERG